MSEASGCVVNQVRRHYVNIAKYNPLEESGCINLLPELKKPNYGLVNIKNKDNQCFLWRHIRRFNPQEIHPERIKKKNQADYWLIIVITQVWNFQLAPNIIAELRPKTR